MNDTETRYMDPEDWKEVKVLRIPHLNHLCVPIGYNRKDGVGGNTLLPACIFEDTLEEVFKRVRKQFSEIELSRFHVKMPYWNHEYNILPNLYSFIPRASYLSSTAITVIMIANANKKPENMPTLEYGYRGHELLSLRDRLSNDDSKFEGIIGNLGYYMTENLVAGILDWTHNKRYAAEYHLQTTKSYLGFYMRRDNKTGDVFSSFSGAHPAGVAVKQNGDIEILPDINIDKYKINILNKVFYVDCINPDTVENEKLVLFTPGIYSDEIKANRDNWKKYAPMIPVNEDSKRVNLFITNEGNGCYPEEKVVVIWNGGAPIPAFGAVLSFDENYFDELFNNQNLISSAVQIIPEGATDFSLYRQIFGGFVPVVIDGNHLYNVETVEDLMHNLDEYGNALSPIAQAGRETSNFDPYIREPAGVLIQTKDKIGWVMFDGRHELSIGVSVSDVAKLVKRLQNENIFKGKILNAVFIDGGSAMKAYAIKNLGDKLAFELLNRAAAGARNGPGSDPDGLNLYSLLKLPLS